MRLRRSLRHNGGVRRCLLVVLSPLALAGCGGGGAEVSSSATTTRATQPARTALVIKVVSVLTVQLTRDKPPKGESKGDRVKFKDLLLNAEPRFGKATNAPVGSDKGTMSFTSSTTARMTGVATLPDGTIKFSGTVTPLADGDISIPVVGGSGKYENARGTLIVGAGARRAPNTYRITVPSASGPVA
jgi:hypothetical protein